MFSMSVPPLEISITGFGEYKRVRIGSLARSRVIYANLPVISLLETGDPKTKHYTSILGLTVMSACRVSTIPASWLRGPLPT